MKLLLEQHKKFSGLTQDQIREKVYMNDYILEDKSFIQYLESKRDNIRIMEILLELKRVKRAFELLEEEEKRNSMA